MADLRATVLSIILAADARVGITATSIHGRINEGRSRVKPAAIRAVCDALVRDGKISAHQQAKAGVVRFARPGVAPILAGDLHRDAMVETVETPAMARQLENLFAICPYDYSHGEVVTLERGRIGLPPGHHVPTRVAGAW